jgi:hypothetical protein
MLRSSAETARVVAVDAIRQVLPAAKPDDLDPSHCSWHDLSGICGSKPQNAGGPAARCLSHRVIGEFSDALFRELVADVLSSSRECPASITGQSGHPPLS